MSVHSSVSSSKFRFRKYYGPADRPYLSLCVSWWDWTTSLVLPGKHLLQLYPWLHASGAHSQRFTHWASFPGPTAWLLPQETSLCFPQDNASCFLTLLLICLLCFASFQVLEIKEPALAAPVCNHRRMEAKAGGWVSGWKPGLHGDRRPQGEKKKNN